LNSLILAFLLAELIFGSPYCREVAKVMFFFAKYRARDYTGFTVYMSLTERERERERERDRHRVDSTALCIASRGRNMVSGVRRSCGWGFWPPGII